MTVLFSNSALPSWISKSVTVVIYQFCLFVFHFARSAAEHFSDLVTDERISSSLFSQRSYNIVYWVCDKFDTHVWHKFLWSWSVKNVICIQFQFLEIFLPLGCSHIFHAAACSWALLCNILYCFELFSFSLSQESRSFFFICSLSSVF